MTLKPTYEELERQVRAFEDELAHYKTCIVPPKQRSYQYLEAFINNINLPIYLKDANYKYIFINKQFEFLAHVACNQIVGKDDFEIFATSVAQLFRSQDEEVVKKMDVVEFEETIVLPDGVQTFMTAKFPLIDREGQVYAVGGICTDISIRKTTEAKLKEAEEKYKGIFEHSPLGILQIDQRGTVIASNEKLAKILGFNVQDILDYNMLRSTQEEEMKSAITSVLSGQVAHREGEFKFHETGVYRHLRGVFSPISTNDGTISSAIGIIEDITVRKEVEEALNKAHCELERLVKERTVKLAERTEKLTETNCAIKILLEKREEDKKEIEENIMFNVEKLIKPYFEQLGMSQNTTVQRDLLATLQVNLDKITSSFAHKYKNHLSNLTPTQIKIADLIKQGKTTKEIAAFLNLSPSTVASHRQEIRKRLFLTNKKTNLQAALTATYNN